MIPRYSWLSSLGKGVLLLLFSLTVGGLTPAWAAGQTVEQKATTASYALTLDIGPLEQMLTPAQAKTATTGEVMVPMGGMGTGMMAMGNHHVEVHVRNKATYAVVKDVTVTITFTNTMSGAVIPVTPVVAMYGVKAGPSDWHYGNNATLPAGTYRATVTVNGQTATFSNLVLAAGGTSMATTHQAMPVHAPSTGGGGLVAVQNALALLGVLALAILVLRVLLPARH